MLNWLIPGASTVTQHPIYHFEIQTKRHRRTLQMIFPTTLKWFLIIFAIMTALWAFALWNASQNSYNYYGYYQAYDASQEAIGWFFFIGLAAGLLIDIVGVLASVGSINRQLVTGHWDLLRLTTLDNYDIIYTKHAVTQIQAWRMLTVVFSVRLTTILLFIVQAVFIRYSYSDETLLENFLDEIPHYPFIAVSVVILVILLMGCYLLEPFWRLRAVTALGMWVSARVRRISSALLAGFGLIPFIWISQGFILYLLYQIIYHLGDRIYTYSDEGIITFFLFWTICFVLIVYAYYAFLKRVGLARAAKDAFKPV